MDTKRRPFGWAARQALGLLAGGGEYSTGMVHTLTDPGMHVRTVQRALARLHELGFIVKRGGGSQQRWAISQKGENWLDDEKA